MRNLAENSTKGTRRLQKKLTPNVFHKTIWRALKESLNLLYEKIKSASSLKKEHQNVRFQFGDYHQT